MKIIQIGCNDGNDHVFELCKRERGIEKLILIDADKDSLSVAGERYRNEGFNNVETHHFAVVPVDSCVGIEFYTTVDPKFSAFTSVSKEHILTHLPQEQVRKYTVPTKSLNQILKEAAAVDFDWLFVDTEGMDALNLFSVDFSLYKIKNIVFEYLHTDGTMKTGRRFNALCYYLSSFGYKIKQDEKLIGSYNVLAYL